MSPNALQVIERLKSIPNGASTLAGWLKKGMFTFLMSYSRSGSSRTRFSSVWL